MVFLQVETSKEEASSGKAGYKTTSVQVNIDYMNVVDMIEWHRQTGEMVSNELIQ